MFFSATALQCSLATVASKAVPQLWAWRAKTRRPQIQREVLGRARLHVGVCSATTRKALLHTFFRMPKLATLISNRRQRAKPHLRCSCPLNVTPHLSHLSHRTGHVGLFRRGAAPNSVHLQNWWSPCRSRNGKNGKTFSSLVVVSQVDTTMVCVRVCVCACACVRVRLRVRVRVRVCVCVQSGTTPSLSFKRELHGLHFLLVWCTTPAPWTCAHSVSKAKHDDCVLVCGVLLAGGAHPLIYPHPVTGRPTLCFHCTFSSSTRCVLPVVPAVLGVVQHVWIVTHAARCVLRPVMCTVLHHMHLPTA